MSAGDSFEFLSREPQAISIAEMNRLFVEEKYNSSVLAKAIATPALPQDWRDYFQKRQSGVTPEEVIENSGGADI